MAECILLGSGGGGFGSDDLTATKNHVLAPYTAITSDSDDEPIAGTIPSIEAGTFYASTGEQTILQSGNYLAGAQKLAKLTQSGLVAGNILRGKQIVINNGRSNVWSVTGDANVLKVVSGSAKLGSNTITFQKIYNNLSLTCKYVDIAPGITPVHAFFISETAYIFKSAANSINFISRSLNKQGYQSNESVRTPFASNQTRVLAGGTSGDEYVWYFIYGY